MPRLVAAPGSLPQGDPLGMLARATVALMPVLYKIEEQVPGVAACTFADDRAAGALAEEQIKRAERHRKPMRRL